MLSIEPFWNWNSAITFPRFNADNLSIEPFWNWNELSLSLLLHIYMHYQSNHFGIETIIKPGSVHTLNILSIEPFWNWNSIIFPTIGIWYAYQSNHFGIETCFASSSGKYLLFYQSNHFGIETSFIKQTQSVIYLLSIEPFWNWNITPSVSVSLPFIPINRTILELKLLSMGKAIHLPGDYQSNHFGIETNWIW